MFNRPGRASSEGASESRGILLIDSHTRNVRGFQRRSSTYNLLPMPFVDKYRQADNSSGFLLDSSAPYPSLRLSPRTERPQEERCDWIKSATRGADDEARVDCWFVVTIIFRSPTAADIGDENHLSGLSVRCIGRKCSRRQAAFLRDSLEREGGGMPQVGYFEPPAPFETENELQIHLYRSRPDPFIRGPFLTCKAAAAAAAARVGGGGRERTTRKLREKMHGAVPVCRKRTDFVDT